MRLLVTGGSGFLGGYVLREAARRGHETVALARSDRAAAAVTALGAAALRGDLDLARDPRLAPGRAPASRSGRSGRLDTRGGQGVTGGMGAGGLGAGGGLGSVLAQARCDVLVNLASLGFGHGPGVVAAAEAAGIRRAVFVSTTAVTTALPAGTKRIRLAAEDAIRSSGLAWTILRPTMIYGAAGDRNLSRLLPLLRRAPLLPVPGGRQLQQPVHVADVAAAVLAAAERPGAAGETYDIAGPEPMTFTELLRVSAAAAGSRTRFVPVPLRPVIALARGYEQVSRKPRIRAEQVQRLAEDKAFAIAAAARDLGYTPRPFAAGITAQAQAMDQHA